MGKSKDKARPSRLSQVQGDAEHLAEGVVELRQGQSAGGNEEIDQKSIDGSGLRPSRQSTARRSGKKIFMLVDGHALMHKGYHAIPFLSTSKGEPTNAIFGFTSILLNAIKEVKPDCIAVTFDLPKPTFRHVQYEKYKAHRKPAPDDLTLQIPKVKEVVRALNIPIYEQAGYEADDLIGTLAKKIEKENGGMEVIIVTGDLDTLQLVTDRVKVYTMKKGLTDSFVYGPKEVEERYGLRPDQMVDYRALKGDPSDNIPGVIGIGEKTAASLIAKYGSLDELYKAVEKDETDGIKPKVLELLKSQKDQAYMSQNLSRIITDIDLNVDLVECRLKNYDTQKVVALFKQFEFRSLISKLPKSDNHDEVISTAVFQGEKIDSETNYTLITSKKDLEILIKKIHEQSIVAVDTETSSEHALVAKLVGVSFSWKAGEAYYVHVWDEPEMIRMLKVVLEDTRIMKYGHNLKYDYEVLQNEGITLRPLVFDSMIGSYLLNPGSRQHDLDTLTFNQFGHTKIDIETLIGKGKKQITMAEVPAERIAPYACEDADYTFRLSEALLPRLVNDKVDHLFKEIEIPLIPVLAQMERWGISLDTEFLSKLSKQVSGEIEKLEKKIYKLAGEEFNINSPSQLAVILFEKLNIPKDDIKRGKTGISTAASELAKLLGLHPIIEEIMQYRELQKLSSTYIEALPELVAPADNRLHTSYNQTIAATGRLSSTDPNLQNIPIRTDLGNEVRKAFVAEKGYNLLSLDYSQIELRIAASLAKDEAMLEIFRKGGDIHAATAARIFNLPEDQVTPSQRRDAKTINFSVLYGVSAFGLSSRSEMSRAEAKQFIDRYFETFPGIAKYIEETIEETRKRRFVANPLGRKRYFPEIISSNFQVRSGAERAAVNMPIQSLAADIMKTAMIEVHKSLLDDENIRMLLQVHDELVFEVKEGEEEKYANKLREIMEGVYSLKAILKADAKVGKNWKEMIAI